MEMTLQFVASLPSVPLREKNALPNVCAVYFVSDGAGRLLYVGSSIDVKRRFWYHANRWSAETTAVRWFECNEIAARTLEMEAIATLRPTENKLGIRAKNSPERVYPIQLDDNLHAALRLKAAEMRVTLKELIATAGRP